MRAILGSSQAEQSHCVISPLTLVSQYESSQACQEATLQGSPFQAKGRTAPTPSPRWSLRRAAWRSAARWTFAERRFVPCTHLAAAKHRFPRGPIIDVPWFPNLLPSKKSNSTSAQTGNRNQLPSAQSPKTALPSSRIACRWTGAFHPPRGKADRLRTWPVCKKYGYGHWIQLRLLAASLTACKAGHVGFCPACSLAISVGMCMSNVQGSFTSCPDCQISCKTCLVDGMLFPRSRAAFHPEHQPNAASLHSSHLRRPTHSGASHGTQRKAPQQQRQRSSRQQPAGQLWSSTWAATNIKRARRNLGRKAAQLPQASAAWVVASAHVFFFRSFRTKRAVLTGVLESTQ